MAIILLYCEGHRRSGNYDGMQSHESRGFNCMSLLTVGAGSAMKFWEKLFIDEDHGSSLSGGIENCDSYRSGPMKDHVSAVFCTLSANRTLAETFTSVQRQVSEHILSKLAVVIGFFGVCSA